MSGGAQQAGTTTTTNAPPSYMYPYIGTALGQAGNLLQTGGPQYYPGQQVASFNPAQQTAMGGITALGRNPGLGDATTYNNDLLTGNFSGPDANLAAMGQGGATNPYLDAMFKQAAGASQGQLESEFGGAGRNVDAAAPLQAQTDNNLATSIYGGAYAQDQANALAANQNLAAQQQGAVGGAQNLLASKEAAQQAALGVGNQVQGQSQSLIDASKNAYNYNQNLPWQNLSMYEQMLSGVHPGIAQSSPYFNNPTGNALGEAALASSIYSNSGTKGGKTAQAASG